MSNARQCDICGVCYPSYNISKDDKNPSGYSLLNIDGSGQFFKGPITDCCPKCMTSIMEHIKKLKGGENV